MATTSSSSIPATRTPSYIDSARNVVCEQYKKFDAMSHRVAARFMGKDVSQIDFKDSRQIIHAAVVKIVLVAYIALVAFVSICSLPSFLVGLALGAVVSKEEISGTFEACKTTLVRSWRSMVESDNLVQVAVKSFAFGFFGTLTLAILLPGIFGVGVAYAGKNVAEDFRAEENRRVQATSSRVA